LPDQAHRSVVPVPCGSGDPRPADDPDCRRVAMACRLAAPPEKARRRHLTSFGSTLPAVAGAGVFAVSAVVAFRGCAGWQAAEKSHDRGTRRPSGAVFLWGCMPGSATLRQASRIPGLSGQYLKTRVLPSSPGLNGTASGHSRAVRKAAMIGPTRSYAWRCYIHSPEGVERSSATCTPYG